MTTCQRASRSCERMEYTKSESSLPCTFHDCHYYVVHVGFLFVENEHERHYNDIHGSYIVATLRFRPSIQRNERRFDRSSFSGAIVQVPTSVPNLAAYLNTPGTFIAPVPLPTQPAFVQIVELHTKRITQSRADSEIHNTSMHASGRGQATMFAMMLST